MSLPFDKFFIINKNKLKYNHDNINKSINIIFEIKPDIQNDIYHLYCLENEYYGIAFIPDYKTSLMMNKLFRKIKENEDLDKLEESDDEEEFENPDIDKFVYLNKSFKIECLYNKRFKKWYPIKIAKENSNISKITDVKQFMSKFITKTNNKYII